MKNKIMETREEKIQNFAEEVNIANVIDSALNGVLEEIENELDNLDCPQEIYDEVRDEVFTNRIAISRG